MKLTNKLGLNEAFINFAEHENTHTLIENQYSVTELLAGVQEIKLARQHYDEIEEDVSEKIPAIFGTAVHKILEINAPDTMQTEVSMKCNIGDCILSGKCDARDPIKGLIEDYKTTSVSKAQKSDFEDYRLQGLMYAYLSLQEGIIIRKLRFYLLLKDWSKIKSINIESYPKNPIFVWEYNIVDSDFDFIEKFIKEKLSILKSNIIINCEDKERWFSGDEYAVYKKDAVKASKIFKTKEDAESYLNGSDGRIEIRYGESTKCKYYCKCAKWCKQYKEELNGRFTK